MPTFPPRHQMRVRSGGVLSGLAALALLATSQAAHTRPLTAKDLVGLNRVSDAHVSPDGEMAVL